MLATTPPATQSFSRYSVGKKVAARTMSVSALKIWVKGDPEKKILGDCPFCHRSLLTLELKGLEYEKDYIDFNNKPDWLFEVHKAGTVPILKDGEEWVPDSDTICEYLEKKYSSDLGPCSLPGVAEKLFPSFVQFLKASDADAAEKEAALLEQLGQLEAYLAEHGPFLHGESMGLADAQVVPRLYHLTTALPHFRDYHVPADKFPNVLKYIEAAKQTDAFKHTEYSQDMVIQGWINHGVAPPKGK